MAWPRKARPLTIARYWPAVDALRGAVKHLTSEQQEVLVLRFVENMSSRQVAKVLGKNEGAIRALQFRALGRLRKILTPEVA